MGRRIDAERAAERRAVVTEAAELIATHGFAGGVSSGTLLRFGDKQAAFQPVWGTELPRRQGSVRRWTSRRSAPVGPVQSG